MAFPQDTFLYKHKTFDKSVIYELFVNGERTEVFFDADKECIELVSYDECIGEQDEEDCDFVDTRSDDTETITYDFDLCSDGVMDTIIKYLDMDDEEFSNLVNKENIDEDSLQFDVCGTSSTYKFRYAKIPKKYMNLNVSKLKIYDGFEEVLKRIRSFA